MRFPELKGDLPLIDGCARWMMRAHVRMIRKIRCLSVGQGQMIVMQSLRGSMRAARREVAPGHIGERGKQTHILMTIPKYGGSQLVGRTGGNTG